MRARVFGAAIIVSLGALFLCERALQHAGDDALSAHQALWDCLAAHNQRLAACRPALAIPSEDMDYCPEAVQACRKNGLYQSAQLADDELDAWHERTGAARALTLLAMLAMLVLVLRFASRQLIGRRR